MYRPWYIASKTINMNHITYKQTITSEEHN